MWCGPLSSRSTVQRMNSRAGSGQPLAVSVPGGELIGVRSGSGRPLLVLHGGPGVNDYSDWFAAELAGWDALRYTQRGVAPSVVVGPFTIERQAAEATAAVFPDARRTIVPGAGHQVWHEAPGCLAAALSRVAARRA